MEDLSAINKRAARIKLLLMDCDGVLTDGRIWLLGENDEQKSFSVKDGLGLELFRRAGLRSGVISGRTSQAVTRRARETGIEFVRQGEKNKVKAFDEILSAAGVRTDDVAFIGDDLNDIPLLQRAELAIAVADAAEEVRTAAHYVTRAKGGYGAVREVVELILRSQGRWSEASERYFKG
jgi:3-deoxy-D-manno-octulosonate 8-phosphate phosphatase (KDO 8-P phosphatase)